MPEEYWMEVSYTQNNPLHLIKYLKYSNTLTFRTRQLQQNPVQSINLLKTHAYLIWTKTMPLIILSVSSTCWGVGVYTCRINDEMVFLTLMIWNRLLFKRMICMYRWLEENLLNKWPVILASCCRHVIALFEYNIV